MRSKPPVASNSRRRFVLNAEALEVRSLLSTAGAHSLHELSIEVPSNYVSDQASDIEVTLVRKGSAANIARSKPLVVDVQGEDTTTKLKDGVAQEIPGGAVDVDETVTVPAGQTSATVALPINPQATSPGLVPVQITVSSLDHPAKQDSTTVELASGPDAVPPIITGAHLVPHGLAITFSKPMDPASVDNVRNYLVTYRLSSQFDPLEYNPLGQLEELTILPQRVHFRKGKYDAATDTVTLVTKGTPGTNGSYRIASPPSLAAKMARPLAARPLTDANGNPLATTGNHVPGYFSFTISRGHPYVVAQPTYSDGN